jgi:hypothetical protein
MLLWACGIMPGSCAIPGEMPTLRERLEQAQNVVLVSERHTARDAERKAVIKRWLELWTEKEAKEKAAQ